MAKEVNLYKFCCSPQMKEKLWRDMFISYIFGVDMPENISVCRLSDDIRDILSAKDFWHRFSFFTAAVILTTIPLHTWQATVIIMPMKLQRSKEY